MSDVAAPPSGLFTARRNRVRRHGCYQRLGATEEQVKLLTPLVAWSSEITAWGFDPWAELTPG